MTPLLFAAVVALSPAGPQATQPLDPAFSKPPLVQNPALAFTFPGSLPVHEACAALASKTVGPDGVPLKKLSELPPGLVEHAVLRIVNGCPVREILFAGQTYYIPGGGAQAIERLEGSH